VQAEQEDGWFMFTALTLRGRGGEMRRIHGAGDRRASQSIFRVSSIVDGRRWKEMADDKQNDLVAAMSLYFFLSIYFHVKS
jgi:hypothetical protein